MSCMWCISFRETEERRGDLQGEKYLRRPGQCTLNPVWVDVTADHFCRHFLQEVSNYGETSTIANWWINSHADRDKSKERAKEMKRLREANKVLREKLKATKS